MAKIRYTNNKNQNISFNSFLCKDGCILYKVIRKNEAHLFLEYREEDKYYVVTCNKSISDADIKQYVLNNYEWLQKWYKNVENPAPWFIFGQKTPVTVTIGNEYKVDYLVTKINVFLRHKRDYLNAVRKFYKDLSSAYLMPRTLELISQLGLNGKFGKTSWVTSYYGKCYGNKTIDFSAQLIQYNKEFIDSVIYHEIAHLTHMNHKKEFWQLLSSYCPNHIQLDKYALDFKLHNHVW